MSLLTALTSGTAGLQANSTDLSVIGDNIANANTIGFKAGRTAFQDQLMQQLIGVNGGGDVGLGANVQAVQRIITQGALTTTGLATDLALDGPGFFVVKGNHSGVEGQFYTRAGQFTVNEDGYLVNLEGLQVQGYPNDSYGSNIGGLGSLQVGNATSAANPTGEITMRANLDAGAPISAAWDPNDKAGTSNLQSTVQVYDSLGASHSVDVYWTRTGAGTWEYHAMTDGGGLDGGTPGTSMEIATGTLSFDTDGKLVSSTGSSNFTPLGATTPQPLTFNLGDDTAGGGTGLSGVTQFAKASVTTFTNQDGNAYGALNSVQVNSQGEIVGSFTNGETRVLGAVAVADFDAADKLSRTGGNLLTESADSGQPTIGRGGEGGRGSIKSGALEQSNVDLANEFVRMITAQRGFQANSKTITTADQLLQELMQLKR